jgi:hypothetical protein
MRPDDNRECIGECRGEGSEGRGGVSRRQGLFSDDDHKRIYAAAERQSRMLSGLRRSLVEGKEV